MIFRPAPRTSTERVRAFRERNPGYDARWKRRREAAFAADAATPVGSPVEALVATPLMLPAPRPPECDLLEQLAALRARTAELELVLAGVG